MSRTLLKIVLCAALGACAWPALAVGPLDGEATVGWWKNDLDATVPAAIGEGSSDDASAAALRAAVYIESFGVRASRTRSRVSGGDGVSYTSFDVMWRPVHVTRNNFFALGVGYERVGIDGSGDPTSSGVRLAAEGRAALGGLFYVYGEGAYFPRLGSFDLEDSGLRMKDPSGHEVEVGIALKPAPFLWVRVGYRDARLSAKTVFEGVEYGDTTLRSKGPIVGVGVSF